MKNSFKYLLIISLLAFAVSCAEDDDDDKKTPTDTSTNYYPLASGSYWVYSRAEVDAEGNVGTPTYEREEVDMEEVVAGHNTTKVNTYESDAPNNFGSEASASNNYYNDNGKVYASISFVEQLLTVEALGITIPLNTEINFIKLIDVNATSWDVIEIPFNDLPLEFNGMNINFTGTAKLKAKYLGEKAYSNTTLSLNGNVAAFEYAFEITGDVKLSFVDAGTITVKSTVERWYMKDIGMVKRSDSAVNVTGTGTVASFIDALGKFPATNYELNSYSVASVSN